MVGNGAEDWYGDREGSGEWRWGWGLGDFGKLKAGNKDLGRVWGESRDKE